MRDVIGWVRNRGLRVWLRTKLAYHRLHIRLLTWRLRRLERLRTYLESRRFQHGGDDDR